MDVFLVHHVHDLGEGDEDVKLIGVYSTNDKAEAAVSRVIKQPGFRETPDGFEITRYLIDEDNWTEGYITITGRRDPHKQKERKT